MSTEGQPEVEELTRAFEQEWAKTWEKEKGTAPLPEELQSHPQYRATLEAWLQGHGVKRAS